MPRTSFPSPPIPSSSPSGLPRETAAFLRISILSILFTLLVAAIISALAASIPSEQSTASNTTPSLQWVLWSPYINAITLAIIATAALFIAAEQARLARATWAATPAPPADPVHPAPSTQTFAADPSLRFFSRLARLRTALRRPLTLPFLPRASTPRPARPSRFWKRFTRSTHPPISPPLPVLLRPREIAVFLIPLTLIVALAHALILLRLRAAALSPPTLPLPSVFSAPNRTQSGTVMALIKHHPTTQAIAVAILTLIALKVWFYLQMFMYFRRQSRRQARFRAGHCLACDYPLRPPMPPPHFSAAPDSTDESTNNSNHPCPECGTRPPPTLPSHPSADLNNRALATGNG